MVSVEPNCVRRLAAAPAGAGPAAADLPRQGGAGVVIGLIDSGLWPDSPLFADVRGLGRAAKDFRGRLRRRAGLGRRGLRPQDRRRATGSSTGFGADRLRSTARLSPLDDDGHGTLMASVAAGNAGVTVRVPGQRAGLYAGAAPQARLAVYKACWTAPDPRDDGCSTADLVTAVDRAVADRVDVLNLSVDGARTAPGRLDTVERALLGAAEADIVVVGASGNRGTRGYAAHASPWVTSVGGTTGVMRRGAVVAPGLRLTGAMAARQTTRPARLVLGARVAAAGSDARRTLASACPAASTPPGSSGRVVVCERGRIGRVDKSKAVRRADGVGMVLVNTAAARCRPTSTACRRSTSPRTPPATCAVGCAPTPSAASRCAPTAYSAPRSGWSPGPAPATRPPFLKPDLVDTAVGVLGATPPSSRGRRWDLATGTSVAAARTSGVAAALLSRHDWSAVEVRSALATTAGASRAARRCCGWARDAPAPAPPTDRA